VTEAEKENVVMQVELARSELHQQVDARMDAVVAALRGIPAPCAPKPPRRLATRAPYAPGVVPSDIDRAKARAALTRMGLRPTGGGS
jgi:hypothetical protein